MSNILFRVSGLGMGVGLAMSMYREGAWPLMIFLGAVMLVPACVIHFKENHVRNKSSGYYRND